jgi:hypothetical protein
LLRNKKVLIISPQPWGKMFVSKHHYAIELARRVNTVYFLEPPVANRKPFIKMVPVDAVPSIILVQYSTAFNLNLRFHFRGLFDRLMRMQVKKICRVINQKLDIAWCFETNLFSDLSWFKAKINIFHVVDPVSNKHQIAVANSANLVFGVSEKILAPFRSSKTPAYFINHGIALTYLQSAKKAAGSLVGYLRPEKAHVGYVGNLLRGPVNYKIIRQIISTHSNINFHFWGNDEVKKDTADESAAFVDFLKFQQNVFLHGQKPPDQLVKEIIDMDAFILVYVFIEGESDQSNSHKLLEYLSTGKVVISSFVDTYKNDYPLICMTKENNDAEFPSLFNKVLSELEVFNSCALQQKRIEIAVENSYDNHINKIENILESL